MNEENSVIVIDQQEQHKKKGALAVILAIAFVAILGIGGTFAYLSYSTNQALNRFTTVPGDVSADVIEPAWDNALKAETATKKYASDGTTQIPAKASEMGAGSSVSKNPFIVNTTKVGEDGTVKGSDEYVAMKLVFEKWNNTTKQYVAMTESEMTTFLAVFNLKGNDSTGTENYGINQNPTWTQFTDVAKAEDGSNADAVNERYFYYAGKLVAMYKPEGGTSTVIDEATNSNSSTWGYTLGSGAASTSLFDSIIYNKDATNDQVTALNAMLGTDNPGWRVTVKGAAIQAVDGVLPTQTEVQKQFKTLLDSNATTGASGWRKTTNGGTGLVPAAA